MRVVAMMIALAIRTKSANSVGLKLCNLGAGV